MLRLFKRRPELILLSHWCKLIENLSFSPEEFYERTTAGLQAREIPKLKEQRIAIHEGGLLSAKRLYMRLGRERIVIDICGAPFGTGFFVSWRLLEHPLRISWIALVALLWLALWALTLAAPVYQRQLSQSRLYWEFHRHLGQWTGIFTLLVSVVVLVIVFLLLRKTAAVAFKDVDGAILQIPIIGPLYERFFRPMTYYRVDIALMFQQAVHAAVTEAVDDISAARGLPPLTADERKPIFNDLYRR